jgi:cysteine desulfurase
MSSNIASCALRSAGRVGLSPAFRVTVAPLRGMARAAVVARRTSQRGYVSETKRDNAQVETAIKLDKKAFADIPPPDTPSNASVSPMAGKCILSRSA